MLKPFLICAFAVIINNTVIAETNQSPQQFFLANQLQIDNLHADLKIKVEKQDGISIVMDGPTELTESIEVAVDGDKLHLNQKKSPATSGISATVISQGQGNNHNMVSINGQTIILKTNDVTVIDSLSQEKLMIEITVPPQTPVSINKFKGDATIGDLASALTLTTSGDVTVGRVNEARIKADHSGDVTIHEVTEQLDLNVSDNAEVLVETGDIDRLSVNVSNNGDAEFNGKAVNAELVATDNGDVTIAHVVNEPSISVSGNADVHIRNR